MATRLSTLSSAAAGKMGLYSFPQVHTAIEDAAHTLRSGICMKKKGREVRN